MNNTNSETIKKLPEIESDSPTTNDRVGFKRFVEPIVKRIVYATDKDTPLTIGIYGEWGSGKTSFLSMVDKELRQQDIFPVWFNAWKYNQEENLWSALIQTILNQTKIKGKWYRRIKVKLDVWLNTLDLRSGSWEIAKGFLLIGLRTLIFGLGLLLFSWSSSEVIIFLNQAFFQRLSSNPITLTYFQANIIKVVLGVIAFLTARPDELMKLFDAKLGIDFSKLKRSKSYRAHIAFLDEFSEEFKRMIKLAGNKKPLVVIIDDLDRCLPEKTIQVLEAIKVFLDIEGSIFLLAVDRDVVEKAIMVKYRDLLSIQVDGDTSPQQMFASLGQNYFEKIVQLPFTLPPISDKQFEDFILSVCPDKNVQLCSKIFADGLPHNPRKVKRLLQVFLFLQDVAIDDIEKGLMRPSLIAKMVIIQSQCRRFYEDIITTPALLVEMERVHSQLILSKKSVDKLLNTISDSLLREKVISYTDQYPFLPKILVQRVDEKDTFAGVNLKPYIFLFKRVIEPDKPIVVENINPRVIDTREQRVKDRKSTRPGLFESLRQREPEFLKSLTEQQRKEIEEKIQHRKSYSTDDEWDVKRSYDYSMPSDED